MLAALIGLRLGRRAETNPPIARLLAGAKSTTALPEHHPGAILLNRLWPLLLFTLLAGGLAFLAPQIPGIAAGFAIIWALAWRRQHAAVAAIEERDGACFYVRRTSPVRPMALERAPGFKALRPERATAPSPEMAGGGGAGGEERGSADTGIAPGTGIDGSTQDLAGRAMRRSPVGPSTS